MIVAVDGLAGSGKSSVCRLVAERLDWLWVSTGIFYRTVAIVAQRRSIDFMNEGEVGCFLAQELPNITWSFNGDGKAYHAGIDITPYLAKMQVGDKASTVSEYKTVREALLPVQRQVIALSSKRGAIVDGRDIGTVVFPAAELKFFMVADLQQRAIRRAGDEHRDAKEVATQIKGRDTRDGSRSHAPMKRPTGAIEIDTTNLTVEQAAEKMLDTIRRAGHILPPE